MPAQMKEKTLTPERETVFRKAAVYARLIVRLLLDPRVSIFLKLLPIGSLLYLFLPDLFPFIVDDALVMGLGVYLFIALSPQEVVQEHLAELQNRDQTAAESSAGGG